MFDKVVFAGGGHRCWWQAGFWEQLSGEIELHPRVIGGVSAGAATACLLYATDSKRALAWYLRELKGVRSNINWFNLVRPGERLMPHAAIYRKALRALLGGENFRQLMWRAPEIRVQYSRLPPGMGPRRALLKGALAYNVERYWHGSLHPTYGQRLGFTHEVKRVQDCRTERELVDLLVASSCTPPFTPMETIDGLPCLDGGLVDSVPIGTVADVPGQTLVLTTRRYKAFAPVFARNGLVYVQPSRKVAASSWDYTSPAKFQLTYDLGRRDAVEFLRTFALGRYQDAAEQASSTAAVGSRAVGESGGSMTGVRPGEEGSDGMATDGAANEVAVPDGMRSDVARSDGSRSDGAGRDAVAAPGATATGAYATGPDAEEHAEMRATEVISPAGVEPEREAFEPMSFIDEAASSNGDGESAEATAGDEVSGDRAPGKKEPGSRNSGSREAGSREAGTEAGSEARASDRTASGDRRSGRAARGEDDILDVTARLADYREPNEAGIAEDLSASQPAASDGQDRSGRSLRASRI